ncbi:exported hypothetical protein [Candidatus Sulfopaludibacter sp. SbA4]|nr:exported hypothetical protein [Candidatus Sulfopaludibacter sp. SbA4]
MANVILTHHPMIASKHCHTLPAVLVTIATLTLCAPAMHGQDAHAVPGDAQGQVAQQVSPEAAEEKRISFRGSGYDRPPRR